MEQNSLADKIARLEDLLRSYKSAIVGFSSGVDSSLVSYMANKTLSTNAIIVLARTETITREDVELAHQLARQFGFRYREISYNELDIPEYAANPVNRCYFCKHELYTRLQALADEVHIQTILDGANTDDLGDYRPGRMAARELKIFSPLIDAQFSKLDVRAAARFFGLPNSEKPAAPCLSSRIPYGTSIDRKSLEQIASAERYIREKGFTNVRVRHHSTVAKVEVDIAALPRLKQMQHDVETHLKQLGYSQVVIDEEGFASGKLNRDIPTS